MRLNLVDVYVRVHLYVRVKHTFRRVAKLAAAYGESFLREGSFVGCQH